MRYSNHNQIGFTPLHWASQNGHLDVVELLIEKDAQVDVPTKVQGWVHCHVVCNANQYIGLHYCFGFGLSEWVQSCF